MTKIEKINIDQSIEILKALSNKMRLRILHLLKEPEENFPKQEHKEEGEFIGGVCVKDIQGKIDLGQSTTSEYMSILYKTGLLEKKRIGQWTYYRRNTEKIEKFEQFFYTYL